MWDVAISGGGVCVCQGEGVSVFSVRWIGCCCYWWWVVVH